MKRRLKEGGRKDAWLQMKTWSEWQQIGCVNVMIVTGHEGQENCGKKLRVNCSIWIGYCECVSCQRVLMGFPGYEQGGNTWPGTQGVWNTRWEHKAGLHGRNTGCVTKYCDMGGWLRGAHMTSIHYTMFRYL